MPSRDGTGPNGTGPVGRGLGPCSGNEQEADQQLGMGQARRRGRRSGNCQPRWGWRANISNRNAANDIQVLEKRQSWLKEQLAAITREIENLSKV